jgi:CheY-like chemotaxis protein
LNDLLHDLIRVFESEKYRYNKLNLDIRLNKYLPDKDSSIIADGTRIHQVLSNLIGNALKFTEKGYIEFGYFIKERFTLLFYVKDTGKGISKENQQLIFDRFRQEEESYTRAMGGTGLGLSISKGLVELMDGEIWVESELGKGSVFYFTIPYQPEKSSEIKEHSDLTKVSEYNWSTKKCIVAEDIQHNFELINEILRKTNIQVVWAKNGLEALEACIEDPKIDIILMDIHMPVMNGFEATEKLKKIRPDIPIIALTAYAMVEDKEKCMKAGCDDYIPKPIDKRILLEKMNLYFDRA